MPPRTIPPGTKGRGRGKAAVGTSRNVESPPPPEIPPNALTIMHPAVAEEFEKSFKSRLVMKPHVFNTTDVLSLHITDVCDMMDAQKLGTFLIVNDDYHENFIRPFYAGLKSCRGYLFKCSI